MGHRRLSEAEEAELADYPASVAEKIRAILRETLPPAPRFVPYDDGRGLRKAVSKVRRERRQPSCRETCDWSLAIREDGSLVHDGANPSVKVRHVEGCKHYVKPPRQRRHSLPKPPEDTPDFDGVPPYPGDMTWNLNPRTGDWCGIHVEGDAALVATVRRAFHKYRHSRSPAAGVARETGLLLSTVRRIKTVLDQYEQLARRSRQYHYDRTWRHGPEGTGLAHPDQASDNGKAWIEEHRDEVRASAESQDRPHVMPEDSVAGRGLLRLARRYAGVGEGHPDYEDRLLHAGIRAEQELVQAGALHCDWCGYPFLPKGRGRRPRFCSPSCGDRRRRFEKSTTGKATPQKERKSKP